MSANSQCFYHIHVAHSEAVVTLYLINYYLKPQKLLRYFEYFERKKTLAQRECMKDRRKVTKLKSAVFSNNPGKKSEEPDSSKDIHSVIVIILEKMQLCFNVLVFTSVEVFANQSSD